MLGIDGDRDIVGDYRATPACTHDRDYNVSGVDRVSVKLVIFLSRNEPAFSPLESVGYSIVDSKYGNAFVDKLAMKKLAAKRSCSDRTSLWKSKVLDGHDFSRGFAMKRLELRSYEGVE